ncbi:hypothetical protein RJ639_010065 [Escallonia herrerae]|uniref:Uncharacterized protein n=1 Tax=Escallonia herrerae TaxID=1293975 RepID=A0AA88VT42_9ASTE|nr:hypothetical protein RJ639_010065 [Escallonia herrerae]
MSLLFLFAWKHAFQPFPSPVCTTTAHPASGGGETVAAKTAKAKKSLTKLFRRVVRKGAMNCLFKSKPAAATPADVVRRTQSLLVYFSSDAANGGAKRGEKIKELNKLIRELKLILYGDNECEPAPEACAQLTREFFRESTLRLLIIFLPKLSLEARKDASQVVSNLQRQPVGQSWFIASDYLQSNLYLMDHLISGYKDPDIAFHYGGILRECIRHQCVARQHERVHCLSSNRLIMKRYVLESEHMKDFFDHIQLPDFGIAADATVTFKELLTRHKSTVADFLSRNYDWLLGDILLDRSNSGVMIRYVSSKDNLRILMNLLRV